MKKKKISLLTSLLFFMIGTIIFLNPEILVKTISYGFGGLLILVGLYRAVNYYIQDKRLGIVNRNEIAFGVTAVILGVIFIFLADAIELLLRFVVGGWIIASGLNKIFKTFYTTRRDNKFYSLFVIGIFLILVGLYIIFVSNLALSIIGLFMMLYAIIDFVSYFVFKPKVEVMDEKLELEEIKEEPKKAKEDIIVEAKFEEKKEGKKKQKIKKN